MKITPSPIQSVRLAAVFAVMIYASQGSAATITLNATDGFGTSSFNTAGNWSNAQAPSAANDYSVATSGFNLRTPADGNAYVFQGNSLSMASGTNLTYKGLGGAKITVNNLTLNGATVGNGSTGTSYEQAGTITLVGAEIILSH